MEDDYCVCLIPSQEDALAIASGRAAMKGTRQKVWRGAETGLWHVSNTADPLPPLSGEPCS